MNFGARLRELRRRYDYTQDELAELFNKKFHTSFNKSTLSQYENGKRIPDITLLSYWADFFDVSTDYLLGRTDIEKSNMEVIAVHQTKGNNKNIEDIEELKNLIRELINEEKNK